MLVVVTRSKAEEEEPRRVGAIRSRGQNTKVRHGGAKGTRNPTSMPVRHDLFRMPRCENPESVATTLSVDGILNFLRSPGSSSSSPLLPIPCSSAAASGVPPFLGLSGSRVGCETPSPRFLRTIARRYVPLRRFSPNRHCDEYLEDTLRASAAREWNVGFSDRPGYIRCSVIIN